MGGALSEPGTMIDLGHDVWELHTKPERIVDIGWDFGNLSPAQMVAEISHVDDSLLLSKLLCCSCLLSGLERLWPQDVGVSMEETGPILRY